MKNTIVSSGKDTDCPPTIYKKDRGTRTEFFTKGRLRSGGGMRLLTSFQGGEIPAPATNRPNPAVPSKEKRVQGPTVWVNSCYSSTQNRPGIAERLRLVLPHCKFALSVGSAISSIRLCFRGPSHGPSPPVSVLTRSLYRRSMKTHGNKP